VTCGDIVNAAQCRDAQDSLGARCVWISDESPPCRSVASACRDMSSKNLCGVSGAVVDADGNAVSCLWLEGNSDGDTVVPGECENKVCC
jgi:hypothetical protein